MSGATLVVLTDGHPDWQPDGYRTELLGTELALRFPVVKLLDYNGRWDELDASPNPSAVVAQLQSLNTARRQRERLRWKVAVTRGLYGRKMVGPKAVTATELRPGGRYPPDDALAMGSGMQVRWRG